MQWNTGLALLVGALVASVIVPAYATRRIVSAFRDIDEVIEPARRLCVRLQADVSAEHSELRTRAVRREEDGLTRQAQLAAQTDQDLAALSGFVSRLDKPVVTARAAIADAVARWRALTLESGRPASAAAELEQSRRAEAVQQRVMDLQAILASESEVRRAAAYSAGRLSIASNVTLVIAALLSLLALVSLSRRERMLIRVLETRAVREVALREAAEALSGAFSADDVAAEIAKSALTLLVARGAFVVHHEGDRLRVAAAVGDGVPQAGATMSGDGVIEHLVAQDAPSVHSGVPSILEGTAFATGDSPVLAIPLRHTMGRMGALFVVSSSPAARMEDDLPWAEAFEHIGTLAYEKVRLLDAEREGRQKLESVMEGRSRLMRGFSHDVKNPLGAADGFAALLLAGVYGPMTPVQTENIGRVRRSIGVALALIDDLHDFVRAEAGRMILNPAPTDVAELVNGITRQYAASADARGLEFSVAVAPNLPLVNIDAARLRQVLGNLLSNAIKYTDTGSVSVTADLSERDGCPDPSLRITVVDTGPGIPPDRHEMIFEEFSRLDPGTHPGAGLGLAISRLIARTMGGNITVTSDGPGSEFSLWLPLAPLQPEAGGGC
ncbi:MAG TPA: HAMP domain-containing sensor histidine kinase [Longimicrobiales bacterium]